MVIPPLIALLVLIANQRGNGAEPQTVTIMRDGSPIAMGTEGQALSMLANDTGFRIGSTPSLLKAENFRLFSVNIRTGDLPGGKRAAVRVYARPSNTDRQPYVSITTSTYDFGPPDDILPKVSLSSGAEANVYEQDESTRLYFVFRREIYYFVAFNGTGLERAQELSLVEAVVGK